MEYAMRVMVRMCLENKKAVRFTSGQLCLVWQIHYGQSITCSVYLRDQNGEKRLSASPYIAKH